jgi:hypothetical protein
MDNKGAESIKAGNLKDAVLAEIFNAYKESGIVYQKTTDREVRRTMLDLKRCYDLAILHLSPLGLHAEKQWDEVKTPFSGHHDAPGYDHPIADGTRPRLED